MPSQDLLHQLKHRRAELIERKERVVKDLSHREEPVVADFDDGAIQQENDEVLGTLVETIDAEIAAIDRSLARAANGLLGVCQKCEQPISAARLEAVPYAITCAACENE